MELRSNGPLGCFLNELYQYVRQYGWPYNDTFYIYFVFNCYFSATIRIILHRFNLLYYRHTIRIPILQLESIKDIYG